MCTMSMVHDVYNKRLEPWFPQVPDTTGGGLFSMDALLRAKDEEIAQLKKLIEEYRTALAAAKTVDVLTGQPDCVDAEKAKLQDQVARLERIIDALLAERAKGKS